MLKVAVLFSGGKDSCYAIWILQHLGWEVAALVTVKPHDLDSALFHYPNVDWAALQAKSMGVPHVPVDVGCREVDELEGALVNVREDYGVIGLATGALASDYQKSRFDRVCDAVGLRSYAPLWHKGSWTIVEDLQNAGFKVMITAVGAMGLGESWLGRVLGSHDWVELGKLSSKHGIHLSGEGGEYETFVLDAPHFGSEIVVEKGRREWAGQNGRFVIEKASLREKMGY